MNEAALVQALAGHRHARRFAPPRLGDRPSLVIDATGLGGEAQRDLERELAAIFAAHGFPDARFAMTSEKRERCLVAVGSGKGGVGKSTVAANLAVALARAGVRTGLVDADIYGPSVPSLLGEHRRPEAENKRLIPLEAHGVRFLSIGQLVEPGAALAWRGPMASSALGQLLDADWADSEILVIDLPPGTGDVQLSLLQKWKPAAALIVSTPQDLALIDAARAVDLFRKMDVPILGLVENMAGYSCPHCGETSDPFGSGGAEAEAGRLGLDFLARIPLQGAIRSASDAGIPPATGDGEAAQSFANLAARVRDALNQIKAGGL